MPWALACLGGASPAAAESGTPAHTRAAEAAEPSPPLPALAEWHYYAEIELPARAGTYITGCRVDFGELLGRLDVHDPVDVGSVRVAEVLPGGRLGPPLPSVFRPAQGEDSGSEAAGQVLWQVEPGLRAGWERRFRVYFDTAANGPKPQSGKPLRETQPTFVTNGDFEAGNGGELPGGWELPKRWGGKRVEVHLSEPTHAVQLRPGQAGWAASLRTPGAPGIAIDPAKRYRFSCRYALAKDHPRGLLIAIYWFDGTRAALSQQLIATLTKATTRWVRYQSVLVPPREAGYVRVELSTQCRDGRVLVDDVALGPAEQPTLQRAFRARPPETAPLSDLAGDE